MNVVCNLLKTEKSTVTREKAGSFGRAGKREKGPKTDKKVRLKITDNIYADPFLQNGNQKQRF